jgi:site-specific recombinase XerD
LGKRKLVAREGVIDAVTYNDVDKGTFGTATVIGMHDDGQLMLVPTLFLASLDSDHTKTAYAQSLKSLFGEIKKRNPGETWRDINQRKVSGWVNGLLLLKKRMDKSSITVMVTGAKEFYKYAEKHGWIDTLPELDWRILREDSEESRSPGGQEKNSRSFGGVKEQYIERELLEVFLSQIDTTDSFIAERDQLAIEIGYETGMREDEIMNPNNLDTEKMLRLIDEQQLANPSNKASIQIQVPIIGKGRHGGKSRTVNFNPRITRLVKKFITGVRRTKVGDKGPLICKKNGKKMSSEHPQNIFRKCRNRALSGDIAIFLSKARNNTTGKLFLSLEQISPTPGAHKSGLSFHALRHTNITNRIEFCVKHGFPLSHVWEQVGHVDEKMSKHYLSMQKLLKTVRNG